jgi:hypothetical protein
MTPESWTQLSGVISVRALTFLACVLALRAAVGNASAFNAADTSLLLGAAPRCVLRRGAVTAMQTASNGPRACSIQAATTIA